MVTAATEELATHARRLRLPALVLPNGYDEETYRRSRLAVRRRQRSESRGADRLCGRLAHPSARLRCRRRCHRPSASRSPPDAAGAVSRRERRDADPRHRGVSRIDWAGGSDRVAEFRASFSTTRRNLAVRHQHRPARGRQPVLRSEERAEVLRGGAGRCADDRIADGSVSPGDPARRDRISRRRHRRNGWKQPLPWWTIRPCGYRMARAAHREVLWTYGPLRRSEAMASALPLMLGNPKASARAFALELSRSAARHPPPSVPETEVVFHADKLEEAEVTVVVPLHNYANYIVEALDSVKAQTLAALDLVVVDDASTDCSLTTAIKWAEHNAGRFNRLTILRNRVNAGLGPTRNAGIDAADTLYVLPLDADNRLLALVLRGEPTCDPLHQCGLRVSGNQAIRRCRWLDGDTPLRTAAIHRRQLHRRDGADDERSMVSRWRLRGSSARLGGLRLLVQARRARTFRASLGRRGAGRVPGPRLFDVAGQHAEGRQRVEGDFHSRTSAPLAEHRRSAARGGISVGRRDSFGHRGASPA